MTNPGTKQQTIQQPKLKHRQSSMHVIASSEHFLLHFCDLILNLVCHATVTKIATLSWKRKTDLDIDSRIWFFFQFQPFGLILGQKVTNLLLKMAKLSTRKTLINNKSGYCRSASWKRWGLCLSSIELKWGSRLDLNSDSSLDLKWDFSWDLQREVLKFRHKMRLKFRP